MKKKHYLTSTKNESDLPVMGFGTIAMQALKALVIILMLVLGVNNCAALLMKSGEPFLTNEWLSYITAASIVPVIVFGVEALVSLPREEKTRRKLAYMVAVIGIVSTLLFLADFSQRFPSDYQGNAEFDMEAVIDEDAASDEPLSHVEAQPDEFREFLSKFSLFFQLLGEAATGAAVAYLYSRTANDYRSARIRLSPEWRKLCQREKKLRKQLKTEQVKAGLYGSLINWLGVAQDIAGQQASAFVEAQQKRNRDLGMG